MLGRVRWRGGGVQNCQKISEIIFERPLTIFLAASTVKRVKRYPLKMRVVLFETH